MQKKHRWCVVPYMDLAIISYAYMWHTMVASIDSGSYMLLVTCNTQLVLVRSQFVVINNQPSSLLPVLSGVLQGSILGFLLFLIYINDIFHINIHNSLLTKCFGPVTNCTDEQLLHDIDLLDWSSRSYLCFNPSKCVHIHLEPTKPHHITWTNN